MYNRILVAVDGSETSNKALVAALQLAKEGGGCVRLVHVVDELGYLAGFDQYGDSSGLLLKSLREGGEKILEDGMAIAKAAGVQADQMLLDNMDGRIAEVIADAAKRWNADLVVVGTHGRKGIGRVLLGSGAEQILRLAPVPVLVVRASESTNLR